MSMVLDPRNLCVFALNGVSNEVVYRLRFVYHEMFVTFGCWYFLSMTTSDLFYTFM